ncbi:cold shock and DUF1294 domain-containing protein [Acinetobacter pittii]|uniref:Cold shock and DUF1294 domain-containing protein n=1 Tax=Acinetobacter haemolyticus TaxID=29430 RepID=A0AAW4J1W4_ACIHA|nr:MULTISPECIES: DUF1294 domain-containing protein [Acinetobacter]MBN6533011.1 cold shock and DUF1294 domain-containing protein [Acinetobacter pittii]MBO3656930.1 cold shock and DUF1294 domain-containing protein [Acinetobacter haemolyticus]
MRDQGRLVEWFDEKGYGFIQPNDAFKDRVFLHIKDFARPGPRPIVGCALEYLVILDERGRYRAQQVTYLKASQVIEHRAAPNKLKQKQTWTPMKIGILVYIGFMVVASLAKWLPPYSLLFVSLMNALSYWLYAQDKEAAQLGNRRVPEQTLHIVDALGGWCAGWYAQQKLRHKTQKQPFRQIYFCTIAFHILLICWLISPLNVFY